MGNQWYFTYLANYYVYYNWRTEGSGKTTAVDTAVKELEKMGYQIVRTREPGRTIPKQIRL